LLGFTFGFLRLAFGLKLFVAGHVSDRLLDVADGFVARPTRFVVDIAHLKCASAATRGKMNTVSRGFQAQGF
jgi:hypothetical protein